MAQNRPLVLMGPDPSVSGMGLGACYPKTTRPWAGAPDGTDFPTACGARVAPACYGVLWGLG